MENRVFLFFWRTWALKNRRKKEKKISSALAGEKEKENSVLLHETKSVRIFFGNWNK